MFTATGTGCSNLNLVWNGSFCDVPIGGPYVPALQQVGQMMGGFNGMMGAFAGGSVALGAAGAVVALGSAGTAAIGATAAAGATTPEGQEAGSSVVDVGTTVFRVFGGDTGGVGRFWTPIDPTTDDAVAYRFQHAQSSA